MVNETEKMTALSSSVGADEGQSVSNSDFTIPDVEEKYNPPEEPMSST